MSDKVQLIKEEIEKRIENLKISFDKNCVTEESKLGICGNITTLYSLLKFIDSIPEEHNEDLEKELDNFLKDPVFGKLINRNAGIALARHFAEWQKQKDYNAYSHIPLKDIHDAWQTLKKNKPDIESYPAVCFPKGADWRENQIKETLQTEYEKGRVDMREEMMKDAVDATIFSELKGSDGSLFQTKSDKFRMNGVKLGDRIKVIPIKTEQQ